MTQEWQWRWMKAICGGGQAMLGEERTLLETAMLVSAAEVLIAPHGGQCFNLIFARPGSLFIEILPGQKSSCELCSLNPVAFRFRLPFGISW